MRLVHSEHSKGGRQTTNKQTKNKASSLRPGAPGILVTRYMEVNFTETGNTEERLLCKKDAKCIWEDAGFGVSEE